MDCNRGSSEGQQHKPSKVESLPLPAPALLGVSGTVSFGK